MRPFCLHSSQNVVQQTISYLVVFALTKNDSHRKINEEKGDFVGVPNEMDDEGDNFFPQIVVRMKNNILNKQKDTASFF